MPTPIQDLGKLIDLDKKASQLSKEALEHIKKVQEAASKEGSIVRREKELLGPMEEWIPSRK